SWAVQILSPLHSCASNAGIEIRRESLFHCSDRFATSSRVIHHLVPADLANSEIFCVGMRKIKATHACTGMHRKGFGQLDACVLLRLEQIEQRPFLGVIGAGGITGSRPDTAKFF